MVSLISDAALVGFQTLNAHTGIVERERLRAEGDLRFAVTDTETSTSTLDVIEDALARDAGKKARRTILSGTDTALQVAVNQATSLRDTITELGAIAIQTKATNIDQDARDELIDRFAELRDRIAGQVDQATVNGLNFIQENGPSFTVKDLEGNNIKITSQDLSAQGLGISTISVTLPVQSTETSTLLKTALETLDTRLETLQGSADQISSALDTAKTATGFIPNGVAELIDPDITLQNAELRAIEIRQRLNGTALAIANVDGFALAGLVRTATENIPLFGSKDPEGNLNIFSFTS